jgi:hypothetical protein
VYYNSPCSLVKCHTLGVHFLFFSPRSRCRVSAVYLFDSGEGIGINKDNKWGRKHEVPSQGFTDLAPMREGYGEVLGLH